MSAGIPRCPSAVEVISLFPLIADQGWAITEAGYIRNAKGQCPLVALGEATVGYISRHSIIASDSWKAMTGLSLGESSASFPDLIWAADKATGHIPALRASMLRHLGLPPEGPQ